MELCEKRTFFFVAVDSGLLGLSGLLTGINAMIFADIWLIRMDQKQRRRPLARMGALSIFLICAERSIRSFYPLLLYYGFKHIAKVLFTTASVLTIPSTCSLAVLQTQRLDSSFRGSVYELSKTERRIIWSLALALVTFIIGYTIVIGQSNPNSTILAIRGIFAALAGIFGMSHILIIDRAFGTRLRALVSGTVSSSSATAPQMNSIPLPSTTKTKTQTSSAIDSTAQIGNLNSPEMGQNEMIASVSPSVTPVASPVGSPKLEETSPSWFEEFQSGTLRDFDQNSHPLLQTAAKNSVLTLWLNVAFLLIVIGAVVFAFRNCLDYYVIVGDILALISTFLASLQIMLSFGHSNHIYQYWCWKVDRCLIKLTLYVVKQEISQKNGLNHLKAMQSL